MRIEQRVERLAPLRRGRQGGMGGAPDVVEAAGPEQRDGGEERRGLLWRHGKTVGAQQAGEGDEWRRRSGESRVHHAAAPVMMASRRGAMWTLSSSSLMATPIDRLKASGQDAPPLASTVAASAQSTASAMPGGLVSGSRRSRPTAASPARAASSATLEARSIMIWASRSGAG